MLRQWQALPYPLGNIYHKHAFSKSVCLPITWVHKKYTSMSKLEHIHRLYMCVLMHNFSATRGYSFFSFFFLFSYPFQSSADKEDTRPVCYISTHVVPLKSKVHLKDWMSVQSKSTSGWMGCLFGQALLLCWQENRSQITPLLWRDSHFMQLSSVRTNDLRWLENSAVLAWTRAPKEQTITSLPVPMIVMNVRQELGLTRKQRSFFSLCQNTEIWLRFF